MPSAMIAHPLFPDDESSPAPRAGKKRPRQRRGDAGVSAPGEGDFLLLDPSVSEEDFFQRPGPPRPFQWSVIWADLMMTLFVLFMVLFVYKTAEEGRLTLLRDGDGGPRLVVREEGEKAYSQVFDYSELTVDSLTGGSFTAIDLSPDRATRIVITGDLLFPSASADLLPESQRLLDSVARYIRGTPYIINIIGHTDDLPIDTARFPSNWELSAFRASAVARFLMTQSQVPAAQFLVSGQGEHQPVAPNTSPDNRAKNRRVEIVITRNLPACLPVGSRPDRQGQ